MKTVEELKVYKLSKIVAKNIYSVTDNLPQEERYVIAPQIKRSAISVFSNIAEGYNRNSIKDFIRFLGIANGSASELSSQLDFLNEVGLINQKQFYEISNQVILVKKMLNKLIKVLRQKNGE